jgi:DNA-binding response OmpR family regulator
MRTALSALPFHVDITALQDLATARTRLARWHYDLVTLLLPLPEADATISCQNLRAVSQRVHILVLDPKGEPGCEVATLAAGANSYLLGPLHPDDLCAYLVLLLWHQTDAVAQSQPA